MKTAKAKLNIFGAFSRKNHEKRKAAIAQIIFPFNSKLPIKSKENSNKHISINARPRGPISFKISPHAKLNKIIPNITHSVSGFENGYP